MSNIFDDPNAAPPPMPDVADPFDDDALDRMAEQASEDDDESDLPPGTYQVFLPSASKYTKTVDGAKVRCLLWKFRVINGPHKGRYQMKRSIFKHEQAVENFLRDLRRCGVNLPKLNLKLSQFLNTRLDLLGDKVYEITVKQGAAKQGGGHFVDVYINRIITDVPIPAEFLPGAKTENPSGF